MYKEEAQAYLHDITLYAVEPLPSPKRKPYTKNRLPFVHRSLHDTQTQAQDADEILPQTEIDTRASLPQKSEDMPNGADGIRIFRQEYTARISPQEQNGDYILPEIPRKAEPEAIATYAQPNRTDIKSYAEKKAPADSYAPYDAENKEYVQTDTVGPVLALDEDEAFFAEVAATFSGKNLSFAPDNESLGALVQAICLRRDALMTEEEERRRQEEEAERQRQQQERIAKLREQEEQDRKKREAAEREAKQAAEQNRASAAERREQEREDRAQEREEWQAEQDRKAAQYKSKHPDQSVVIARQVAAFTAVAIIATYIFVSIIGAATKHGFTVPTAVIALCAGLACFCILHAVACKLCYSFGAKKWGAVCIVQLCIDVVGIAVSVCYTVL